jgi:hypothetical protein
MARVVCCPDFRFSDLIVAEIESEQTLVNANRELILRMEAKFEAAIDRVLGGGSTAGLSCYLFNSKLSI